MVNQYIRARKVAKLLNLLTEFNLDPRELQNKISDLETKLETANRKINELNLKINALEIKPTPSDIHQYQDEEGLTFYEMYTEMMTGVPTKGTK